MRLKVYWKSNLPSRAYSVLTSFYCILNGYVIFLKIVPSPLPSCFISSSETLLSYSHGKKKGDYPSSVVVSKLSMGIVPARQGVKKSLEAWSRSPSGRTVPCLIWAGIPLRGTLVQIGKVSFLSSLLAHNNSLRVDIIIYLTLLFYTHTHTHTHTHKYVWLILSKDWLQRKNMNSKTEQFMKPHGSDGGKKGLGKVTVSFRRAI